MQFDVVIPTRGDLKTITPLFLSLNKQALLPENIFLVFDKQMTDEEWSIFGQQACGVASGEVANRLTPITNVTHDFVPGQGAAYARNYGIQQAKSKYVYLIDDDNILDEDFFEKSVKEYQQISQYDTLLYSPSIGRRQSDRTQSVGIRQFHYWLSWPEPMFGGWKARLFGGFCNLFRKNTLDKDFYFPQMIGGNSLLGKTTHFKELKFDERMPFIFEDIDLTHRWFRIVGPIAVSKHNIIHHMERDKTKLEHSFIANVDGVYQKAKNRIIFVKNNANSWQKIQFFGLGLWINTLWFSVFILLMAPKKMKMIAALLRGTRAGLRA